MKKIHFVSTANGCNNNCIGCGDNVSLTSKDGRDIEDISRDLELGAESGYKILHLAGGEVTIQSNIFQILKKAKELYDHIYITSNGRMFSYRRFAVEMARSGVTFFKISLLGPDRETHESWTRTPGSFEQTIRGIRNLSSLTKNICVNHLAWRGSHDKIGNTMRLVESLGVNKIDFFNLAPVGRARENYGMLFVDLTELTELEKQIALSGSFESIELEDFPLCVFSEELVERRDVHAFDTSGKIYTDAEGNVENYSLFAAKDFGFCIDSNITIQKNIDEVRKRFGTFRKKTGSCKGCKKRKACSGIFSEYIRLKGIENVEREIGLLRRRQGF